MFIGAIDIGGSKTISAIISQRGEILAKKSRVFLCETFTQHADAALAMLSDAMKDLHLSYQDLTGIGVSLPGMVNPHSGLLYHAPFANWHNIEASLIFQNLSGLSNIKCENDVNACALGEMAFSKTKDHFIWLTISNGIGGALVSERKLIYGSSFAAGEIGHVKVEFTNPRTCSCGQRGCLEAHCSGAALGNIFKEQKSYGEFLTKQKLLPTAKTCADLALQGDEKCRFIYETAGKQLGIALSHSINLFNPLEIYIGGGVSPALPLFYDEMKKSIEENVISQCKDVQIKPTALGYYASLLGAASLIL